MSEKAKKIIFMAVIPAVLAAALAAAIYWGAARDREREELETAVAAMYTRAFTELTENMYGLETSLAKLTVAGSSTQTVLLLDDVWRLSGVCVGLMSQIPSSHVDTASMNAFVIRVGDYSRVLTKRVLAGRTLSADDAAQIDAMYGACAGLTAELRARLDEGAVPVAALTGEAYFTEGEAESREGITEFPTLIYDGPFSESVENAEAKGVTGDEMTAEEAAAAVEALFSGATAGDIVESSGAIPAYDMTLALAGGGTADVSVTRTGGWLLWFKRAPSGDAEGVPDDETVEGYKAAALGFLESCGYGHMTATYGQYYSGTALICFAADAGGVTVYSDLVKVWLDRETGDIVGLDARNWLSAHCERDIPEPAISEAEAAGLVSGSLEVIDTALALIPRGDGSEALCWEFRGRRGEDEFVIYVNAETGAEEQIFKIISDENGQLAI